MLLKILGAFKFASIITFQVAAAITWMIKNDKKIWKYENKNYSIKMLWNTCQQMMSWKSKL